MPKKNEWIWPAVIGFAAGGLIRALVCNRQLKDQVTDWPEVEIQDPIIGNNRVRGRRYFNKGVLSPYSKGRGGCHSPNKKLSGCSGCSGNCG